MIKSKYVISAIVRELIIFTLCIAFMTLSARRAGAADNQPGTIENSKSPASDAYVIYEQIDFGKNKKLNRDVFVKAFTGYLNLKEGGKINRDIISVCDFSLSSNVPRLWVIDMKRKKVLFNTLVAHGQGTGEEYATRFSNTNNSHQSSLGFYITKDTYSGDNGYSLYLDGMDRGYNCNAYARSIVMHGADYVSETFIQGNQRLGRSWGCPAVSRELAQPIIDAIKGGSCLFIYFPDKKYLASSEWLKPGMPAMLQQPAELKKQFEERQKQGQSPDAETRPSVAAEKLAQKAPVNVAETKTEPPRNVLNADGTFSAH